MSTSPVYPRIILHWLEYSRSQRILLFLEELAVPYELKEYKRDPITLLAPPELLSVHPLGKSPVCTIQETAGGKVITLAESGAIVEFLTERYGQQGRLSPGLEDAELRAKYLHWLHFAEGSAMLPVMLTIAFNRTKRVNSSDVVVSTLATVNDSYVTPKLVGIMAYLESELEGKQFLLGATSSAADIMMYYPTAGIAHLLPADYPNVRAWMTRIEQLPSFVRAEKVGGPSGLERFLGPGAAAKI